MVLFPDAIITPLQHLSSPCPVHTPSLPLIYKRERERYRQTETERDRQTERERERDRQTNRQRQRERQTDRERDRQTDRQRDREIETDMSCQNLTSPVPLPVRIPPLLSMSKSLLPVSKYPVRTPPLSPISS